jgi:hypothetical protein
MSFLEVSTTIGCPMACSYCPQDLIGQKYAGPRRMTFETFAAALRNCPPDLGVAFAGYAEPFLNRNCGQMIELAADQGRAVQVYTTGVGLSDADAETIVRAYPKILMMHLPDGDGDMKASVTTEYVGRIRRLSKQVASFRCVCYGSMHPLLLEFKPFLKNYGLHSRAGNLPNAAGFARVRLRGPIKCRVAPALDENVLLPSGELALCCQDYGLAHVIGDLLAHTWAQIHGGGAGGERLAALRATLRSENGDCLCRTCEFAEPGQTEGA